MRRYIIAVVTLLLYSVVSVAGNSSKNTEIETDCAYVDLGLPSGTLWANCNVGAVMTMDTGDYFGFGHTQPQPEADPNDTSSVMPCVSCLIGESFGYKDSLQILPASHDAATAIMGQPWRIPTMAEVKELLDYCDWNWIDYYNGSGISGYWLTSKINKQRMFLPATGCRDFNGRGGTKKTGYYWLADFHTGRVNSYVNVLILNKDKKEAKRWSPAYCYVIRPVMGGKKK